MTISQKQAAVIADLNSQIDWAAKITRIIAYGADLPAYPTDAEYSAERFVVRAADCSTRTYFLVGRSGQNQYIRAKSNATIPLGLAGLLHYIYNGQPLNDVADFTPTFITACGLDTHLTVGQLNLLNAMMGQIYDFIHDVPMADEPTPQEEINRLAIVALQTRATADETLISNNAAAITTEATNRQNADAALQTAVDNEVAARGTADTALQGDIDTEEAARIAADAALQTAVNNEVAARQTADATLQTAVNNEVAQRQAADTALQGNITTEATQRQSADVTLQGLINQVSSKVNNFIPQTLGTEGQVLTVGNNNNVIWKNPPTAGYEIVTVVLTTQDGQGTVSGLTLSVQVEGENAVRTYTTDSAGKCTFRVGQGLNYTITFPNIAGYAALNDITYRAALSERTITALYRVDTSATLEHVVVDVTYSGAGLARATTLDVVSEGVTSTYSFVGNRCEFNVERGKAYRIDFSQVEGYAKPVSRNYTAALSVRAIRANYIGAITGLGWIKTNGELLGFGDVRAEDRENLIGLYVATSALVNAGSAFIVPLAYLLGETVIGTKQWCSDNIQFESIGNYPNASAASTDDGTNFSGESNTAAVMEEAVTKGVTVPAFAACNAIQYTVQGVTKNCFLGSYMQMKTLSDNVATINNVCMSVFEEQCIKVNVGYWWTSTQCSALNGVRLYGGGFDNGIKLNSFQVVPFLAY